MAQKQAVELRVAGQRCRVVTSAGEDELRALAMMVEEKLAAVLPAGRPVTTQAMLLAAVALAHDVHAERRRSERVTTRARETLGRLIHRVDEVLAACDDPSPSEPPPRMRRRADSEHES
jgi:cell division protein ZapA